jgi:hypothetical protein
MHGHMNVTMHDHMNVTMHDHKKVTMHGHMNVKISTSPSPSSQTAMLHFTFSCRYEAS